MRSCKKLLVFDDAGRFIAHKFNNSASENVAVLPRELNDDLTTKVFDQLALKLVYYFNQKIGRSVQVSLYNLHGFSEEESLSQQEKLTLKK